MSFEVFSRHQEDAPLEASIHRSMICLNAACIRAMAQKRRGRQTKDLSVLVLWDAESRLLRLRFTKKTDQSYSFYVNKGRYRAHVVAKKFFTWIGLDTSKYKKFPACIKDGDIEISLAGELPANGVEPARTSQSFPGGEE